MTLGAALYTHLTTAAGVAAIAGSRVYPVNLPQPEMGATLQPSIAFRLSSRQHEGALGGKVMVHTRWEVACLSESYDTAHALAEAVIAAMDFYRGTMGGSGGVDVRASRLENASDLDEADLGFYAVVLDFTISNL